MLLQRVWYMTYCKVAAEAAGILNMVLYILLLDMSDDDVISSILYDML
jgi:hypothetical protein